MFASNLYRGLHTRSAAGPTSSTATRHAPVVSSVVHTRSSPHSKTQALPNAEFLQSAAPATVCTLGKNRKALRNILKSQRRRLEAAQPAVASASVLGELFSELSSLSQHLEQGGKAQFRRRYDDDSDSDSDEECEQRSAPCNLSSKATVMSMVPVADPQEPKSTLHHSSTLVVQSVGSSHAVQLQVPELDWDSPEFAARDYETPGKVWVCTGSKCRAKGASELLQAVSMVAGSSAVEIVPCKCLGKCKEGAVMRVKEQGAARCAMYTRLAAQEVPSILDSHFMQPAPQQAEEMAGAACCIDCKTA